MTFEDKQVFIIFTIYERNKFYGDVEAPKFDNLLDGFYKKI